MSTLSCLLVGTLSSLQVSTLSILHVSTLSSLQVSTLSILHVSTLSSLQVSKYSVQSWASEALPKFLWITLIETVLFGSKYLLRQSGLFWSYKLFLRQL